MASAANTNEERVVSVVAGGVAGVCSTCVTNPLDTIRSRLAASRGATGLAHKSLICTARDLFSSGAFEGFRVGLVANLVASMPSNAVYLPAYRMINNELTRCDVNHHVKPVAAAIGAVCTTNLLLSPLFFIRTAVQVDSRLTFWHVLQSTWKKDGVKGFYRGALMNVMGRVVEEATFWYVYEQLKRVTKEGSFENRNFAWASVAVLSLSSVAKVIGSSIAYPYNVVMTHLRTANKATGVHEHTRILPTVAHIFKADGVLGFYKGLAPQLLRSVLSKATQIYTFELVMAAYVRSKRREPQVG